MSEPVLDLTGTTQSIEDNHISVSTKANYIRTLVQFMMYLYDNKPNRLVNLNELIEAHCLDNGNNQKNLRKQCKIQIERMNRQSRDLTLRKVET